MFIFKIIDGLFMFMYYLVWAIGLLSLVGSIILGVCNIQMGLSSVLLFVAAFLLSLGITVGLMPKALIERNFLPKIISEKRYIVSVVLLVIATAITGIIYFINGGFPPLNLIFMSIN